MMRTLLKCAGVVAMAAVWGGVAWGQTPSITPTTLPNGEVGVAYNQTLDAGDALPTCCTWRPQGHWETAYPSPLSLAVPLPRSAEHRRRPFQSPSPSQPPIF